MNTLKGKDKLNHFRILLDSGCSSTIVMGRLIDKLGPKKYYLMQWHTQAGNTNTNVNFKIDFTLPELIETNVLTWKFHVDDSAKSRYDIILGGDNLIEL